MKKIGIAILVLASFCCAQESSDFHPAETNVWGADYPRVDGSGRVQLHVKAPDARGKADNRRIAAIVPPVNQAIERPADWTRRL